MSTGQWTSVEVMAGVYRDYLGLAEVNYKGRKKEDDIAYAM